MRSVLLPKMKKRGFALLLLVFHTACAATGDVRDLGFWGVGWQFTAVQNRLQPAIPPVLAYLQERHPGVNPAEVPKGFERDFQAAILDAPAAVQDRLTRRMVGVFAVSGMPCAAEGYPVRDGDRAVAVFIVLDLGALSGPPRGWTLCPPVPPGEAGERVPALRALLSALVAAQAPKRLSRGP